MITINAQAKHDYRLVVMLTDAQREALERVTQAVQERNTPLSVNRSDVVRQLIHAAEERRVVRQAFRDGHITELELVQRLSELDLLNS